METCDGILRIADTASQSPTTSTGHARP